MARRAIRLKVEAGNAARSSPGGSAPLALHRQCCSGRNRAGAAPLATPGKRRGSVFWTTANRWCTSSGRPCPADCDARARLRAIETGRSVVNISTVGTSQVIDATGRTIDELPAYEAGAMVTDVELREGFTPAVVLGGFVPTLIVVGAIAGLVVVGVRGGMQNAPRRTGSGRGVGVESAT